MMVRFQRVSISLSQIVVTSIKVSFAFICSELDWLTVSDSAEEEILLAPARLPSTAA